MSSSGQPRHTLTHVSIECAVQYEYYGSCGVGVAFTTITVVAAALLVALCGAYSCAVLLLLSLLLSLLVSLLL